MNKIGILALAAFVACDEPFSKDPNEAQAPKLEEVLMRDGSDHGELTGAEAAAFLYTFTNQPIYPSNYPVLRFNKLLNGDTIERIDEEANTGKPLGQCGLADGNPITLEVGGNTLDSNEVFACYSPSDLTIEIRPSDGEAPVEFLPYETDYVVQLTQKITDKKGAALPAQTITLPVRPFEVLSVTSGDQEVVLYGAPGTPFEAGAASELTTKNANTLRIVFSGPMQGAPATASLLVGASVINNATNTVYSLTDSKGKVVTSVVSGTAPGAKNPSHEDTRIVDVYPPDFILSGGDEGFPPGEYTLRFTTDVTDDSSVTGAAVKLKGGFDVPFTVVEAAE